jgi:hypothetical protein
MGKIMSEGRKQSLMDIMWNDAISKKDFMNWEIAAAKSRGQKVFIIDTEHPEGGYYV